MAPDAGTFRRLLESVRDAGMNMLRVVGTGSYESDAFHDLCDELGIMIWQDLMFANLDYPLSDPEFLAAAQDEARDVLARLAGRPSLTVVCGNSEVEQQAAMLGLERDLGRSPFYDEDVPGIVDELGLDCAYVRSTPCGGALPFHPGEGIAHYFGVTGYFRPPTDARRADVRFAAECLAFANVPDDVEVPVHHPRWKEGVMRDAGTGWDLGSGWDFDDVRDHYLELLFGVDPVALRRYDHARYLELSRFTSAEVMAEVIGEWRRGGSPCRGALVLWLKDMMPGAGLGVLDHAGAPKVAFHHLRRAFAPVAVWSTDEGVGGIVAHLANDRPEPLAARLRVATYRDFEEPVDRAERGVDLGPHAYASHNVEDVLGRFVDAAWAYRFGEATQDLIVLSLESANERRVLSQAFVLPAGRPAREGNPARLGLSAVLHDSVDASPELVVSTRRFAYGVRVHVPGFRALDDAFSVEPGGTRRVRLVPTTGSDGAPDGGVSGVSGGRLTALNLRGHVGLERAEQA
jgi:beta-mannosidase